MLLMINMSISKMGVSSVFLMIIAVAALAYSKSIDVSAIPEQALVITLDNSSLMVQGADGADGVKGADGADGADGQSSLEEIFIP